MPHNEDKTITIGRPSIYNEELAAVICALIAEGHSLRKIAALQGMPQVSTIMHWLFHPSSFRDSFLEQYQRARQMQAELHADELIDIADDSMEDEVFTDDGRRMLNKEFVQRSKLRVETRQWVASRLLPKVYGPKPAEQETNGPDWDAIGKRLAEAMAPPEASGDNRPA